MSRRFLVTGCGRSGTAHTANVFTLAGLPCGHESVFKPTNLLGASDLTWPEDLPGEASWLAAPFVGCLPPGTVVLHQVREPVAVIRSHLRLRFFETPSPYLDFALRHFPELADGTPARRALLYWVGWNRTAEAAGALEGVPYFRFRVEDLDADLLLELFRVLEHPLERSFAERAIAAQPGDFNRRGDPARDTATWSGILSKAEPELREEAERLAAFYGYGEEGSDGLLRPLALPLGAS